MKVFVIGRDPVVKAGETAFKVNDPSNVISRTHCRITQIDNQTFILEDAGSKNGVIVNNKLVNQPMQVNLNDALLLPNNVKFTINDVISGANISMPESKQKDIGARDNVKGPQVQQGNPKSTPREPPVKKAVDGFKKPQKPLAQVQKSAPVSAGVGGGGIGMLPILAIAVTIALAAVSAYYISNYESGGLSGRPSLMDRLSGAASLKTANWQIFDNGIVRFKYPYDWVIIGEQTNETVVIGSMLNDVGFAVSWIICDQYKGHDVYEALSQSFNCSMIEMYINDPQSILVIGLANNMTIQSDMTRLRGKSSWRTISVYGDAIDFQSIDIHDFIGGNTSLKTRRAFQMNAASLIQSNVLLTASAACLEKDGVKYNEVFKEILRSIEYR